MPSDESKGSQLDAIGSLAQRQLDNTVREVRRIRFFRNAAKRRSRLLKCPCAKTLDRSNVDPPKIMSPEPSVGASAIKCCYAAFEC